VSIGCLGSGDRRVERPKLAEKSACSPVARVLLKERTMTKPTFPSSSRRLLALLVAALSAVSMVGCADEGAGEGAAEEGREESGSVADELRRGDGSALCTSLPAASRELCALIPDNGWRGALKAELMKPYFRELAENVRRARAKEAASSDVADAVYPPADETFAALRATPPEAIKVVIVGQDPYVGEGQANGLGFGVNPGVDVPPSLNNIFAELVREATEASDADALPGGFVCPASGDLTSWAKSGVLFVEAILTVQHGRPGSHKDFGWQSLTDAILRVARDGSQKRATAYLLWGRFAEGKQAIILGQEAGATRPPRSNVKVLTSAHPSPLTNGFVGNDHFASANRFLVSAGRTPITWKLPGVRGAAPSHSCVEKSR
jgi:uracil-DNA glycosylase